MMVPLCLKLASLVGVGICGFAEDAAEKEIDLVVEIASRSVTQHQCGASGKLVRIQNSRRILDPLKSIDLARNAMTSPNTPEHHMQSQLHHCTA